MAGFWHEFGKTLLKQDVNQVFEGSGGPITNVTDVGCGCTLRITGSLCWLVSEYAGGHLDGWGTAGYNLNLYGSAATTSWARHRNTIAVGDVVTNDSDGDGRNNDTDATPISHHTGAQGFHDTYSSRDRYVLLGHSALYGGDSPGNANALAFNYSAPTTVLTSYTDAPSGDFAGGHVMPDFTNNVVVKISTGETTFYTYDLTDDTWSSPLSCGTVASDVNMALDPTREEVVQIGHHASQVRIYDYSAGGTTDQTTTSIPTWLDMDGGDPVGICYDSDDDVYVAWFGGETLATLDPDTWAWTDMSLDTQPVTPSSPNTIGTQGDRFGYIPADASYYSDGAYVVWNKTTESVYVFDKADTTGPSTAIPSIISGTQFWQGDTTCDNPETATIPLGHQGQDRCLFVFVAYERNTTPNALSSPTIDGNAITTSHTVTQSRSSFAEDGVLYVYPLGDADTGLTGDKVFSAAAAQTGRDVAIYSFVAQDVDQTTPIGTPVEISLTSTVVEADVTTTTANSLVACCFSRNYENGPFTAATSNTIFIEDQIGGGGVGFDSVATFREAATTGTYTMGATADSNDGGAPSATGFAFEIFTATAPAGGGGSSTLNRRTQLRHMLTR